MATETTLDQKEFRKALGAFATGVTVITGLAADGAPVGVTASSFNSVSLDPPMVLWSLAKNSRSLEAFKHSPYFAVHILALEQDELSNRFARSGADKFAGIPMEHGAGGVPLLTGCAARLQCRTAFQYEGGDHIIFVGEVVDMDRCDAPALVFQAGRYAMATAKPASHAFSVESEYPQDDDASFSENFTGYLLARAHFQFYSQLRSHLQTHGLSDTEYFVLSVLVVRDGRSIANFNERFSYTGHQVTQQLIARLEVKGLIRTSGPVDQHLCHLSEKGRNTTLHIIAAAKALESDMMARLGEWDAVALKNLLKQFILHTDPGLAHPWTA